MGVVKRLSVDCHLIGINLQCVLKLPASISVQMRTRCVLQKMAHYI